MSTSISRTAPLAIGLTLAVVIAVWEFIGLRSINPDRPLESLESEPVPWGGLAGREAARFLGRRWRLNEGEAAGPLLDQLGHYPLDPWRWLLYSRIQWANTGDPDRLRESLAAAISVQPKNREVRWQAANLAQSTGNADLVLDQLAQWLADEPRATARALFIAGRWADGPGTLLDRVVPDDEAFLAEAMEYAYRSHNVALAQAVWQRLEHPRDPEDEAFADYVRTALNNKRPELAMQAWQRVDPDYTPGNIPAGNFGLPLEAMPTFGWNLTTRNGVTVERVQLEEAPDQARGDKSTTNERTKEPKNQKTRPAPALRISFNGKENVHLATPYARFPIPEPGRYRLVGQWRAEALTTRSLPYLQIYAESPDHRFSETVQVPAPDFDWQRFELPFEVTEPNEIFRFRLRRNRTDAFDKYIDGSVWLYGLGIEKVGDTVEGTVDEF